VKAVGTVTAAVRGKLASSGVLFRAFGMLGDGAATATAVEAAVVLSVVRCCVTCWSTEPRLTVKLRLRVHTFKGGWGVASMPTMRLIGMVRGLWLGVVALILKF
jgi:hypothetical protein